MAANRSDIEAGKAHVTLWLKKDQLVAGLKSVQQTISSAGAGLLRFGAVVTAAGTSIIAPLTAAVYHFAKAGDQLDKMSARTGVAAAKLAALGFAAEQSGAAIEDIELAIKGMQKNGFSADQFDAIAASIAAIEDPNERVRRSFEVFGKAGTKILPMFASLAELQAEAAKRGLLPTDNAVKDAAAITDAFNRVHRAAMATVFNLGAALAPVLLPALEMVAQITSTVSKWAQENAELVQIIAGIGLALAAAGTVAVGLGTGLVVLGALIASISTLIALTLNPVGAIVVAIVAGVAAIGTALVIAAGGWMIFTKSGRATANAIREAFSVVFDYISKSLRGVLNASLAGDFDLAWQIVALSFKAWMTAAINDVFNLLIDQIINLSALLEDQMSDWGKWMFGGNLAELRKELEALRDATAESSQLDFKRLDQLIARAAKISGSGEQSGKGSSLSDSVESMKSFGSFDAVALTMQNWGRGGGVQEKTVSWLQKIYEANVNGHAATKRAIEDGTTYGE